MEHVRIHTERFDPTARFHFDLVPSPSEAYREPVFETRGLSESLSPGMKRIAVRPGVSLTVSHYETTTPFRMGIEAIEAPASFCFRLEGTPHHSYRTSPIGRTEIVGKPGYCFVSRMCQTEGHLEVPPSSPQLSVALQLDPALLGLWIEESGLRLPEYFDGLIASGPRRGCFASHPMNARSRAIAHDVASMALKGGGSRLLFESRALELLDLEIRTLTTTHETGPPFPEAHRDRLFAARELLVADIQNPPTISILARMVAINEFQLKKDFKILFGAPIHATLTRYRMEAAWKALSEDGMGVSEAAWHVGYTNVSHFIMTFRKHYGFRPGCLVMKP